VVAGISVEIPTDAIVQRGRIPRVTDGVLVVAQVAQVPPAIAIGIEPVAAGIASGDDRGGLPQVAVFVLTTAVAEWRVVLVVGNAVTVGVVIRARFASVADAVAVTVETVVGGVTHARCTVIASVAVDVVTADAGIVGIGVRTVV